MVLIHRDNPGRIAEMLKKIDPAMKPAQIFNFDKANFLVEVTDGKEDINKSYPFFLISKTKDIAVPFYPSDDPEKFAAAVQKGPIFEEEE